ncbi:MAG TPA: hypothetical protein PKN64_17410 [Casimicrobium sp.]|jgi:hypothetical protein|nr:hypothetical protein [Casimicrobium sp.]
MIRITRTHVFAFLAYAAVIAVVLGLLAIVRVHSGALDCDQSKWVQSNSLHVDQWRARQQRETYVAVIGMEVAGKTPEEVRRLLGPPEHNFLNSAAKGYGYLLGETSYLACDGALSLWLAISFGEAMKATSVRVFPEVF